MEIKPYSELKIGDQVFHSESKEFIGIVTWLGKAKDLHPNELLDWEMTATEIDNDYDILKVDEATGAFDDCITLFNYNGDPSGVEAYKPTSYFFSLEDYQFHGTKPKGPIVFIQKDELLSTKAEIPWYEDEEHMIPLNNECDEETLLAAELFKQSDKAFMLILDFFRSEYKTVDRFSEIKKAYSIE